MVPTFLPDLEYVITHISTKKNLFLPLHLFRREEKRGKINQFVLDLLTEKYSLNYQLKIN